MCEIERRTLEAQPTLTMHAVATLEEIPGFLGPALNAVAQHAGSVQAEFAGPPLCSLHPGGSLDDRVRGRSRIPHPAGS